MENYNACEVMIDLMRMISRGTEFLLNNSDELTSGVEELTGYSSSFTPKEQHFLACCKQLEEKVAHASDVAEVAIAKYHDKKCMRHLLYHNIEILETNTMMHECNIAVFANECSKAVTKEEKECMEKEVNESVVNILMNKKAIKKLSVQIEDLDNQIKEMRMEIDACGPLEKDVEKYRRIAARAAIDL